MEAIGCEGGLGGGEDAGPHGYLALLARAGLAALPVQECFSSLLQRNIALTHGRKLASFHRMGNPKVSAAILPPE
jgi:hypothetical protein